MHSQGRRRHQSPSRTYRYHTPLLAGDETNEYYTDLGISFPRGRREHTQTSQPTRSGAFVAVSQAPGREVLTLTTKRNIIPVVQTALTRAGSRGTPSHVVYTAEKEAFGEKD